VHGRAVYIDGPHNFWQFRASNRIKSAMSRRPFRIGRSLTGLGLFATRPIKKHTRIAEYKGPILNHEDALKAEARGNRYLYEVSKERTIDGAARNNIARYFNHSCNPNAESIIWRARVFVKTLRNIKPGEEITYDYGTDYLNNVIGRSNCKCSRCRKRKARIARERRELAKRRAARLANVRKKKTSKKANRR
jgi:SET domain-containing protein